MQRPILIVVLVFSLAVAGCYWILITPDNPFTALFRGRVADVNAQVVSGPYPTEADLQALLRNDVKTVVTLLDPALPYEQTLLEQERRIAERLGINLLNFPMASVFGQHFGADYERNAQAAADAIRSAPGKVYLHCYLGLHRVRTVIQLLDGKDLTVGRYTLRQGERSAAAKVLDQAELAYQSGRYDEVAALLADRSDVAARMLLGWSGYKRGDLAAAQAHFEAVLREQPDHADANSGMAYCALRRNDAAAAESRFRAVLAQQAGNTSARSGLGLALYRQGRLAEAATELRAAQAQAPHDAEIEELLRKIEPAR